MKADLSKEAMRCDALHEKIRPNPLAPRSMHRTYVPAGEKENVPTSLQKDACKTLVRIVHVLGRVALSMHT